MTHKLASWIDQFGSSGCVGCGRCITWCPVAIDITEEVAAIRANDLRDLLVEAVTWQRIERDLAGVAALSPLTDEHRATIAGCARNQAFQHGDYLMREGEPADVFYVIRTGSSRSTSTCPSAAA